MHTLSDEGLENRKIILLRILSGNEPEVLLGMDGALRTLPQVRIAPRQRIAEQLSATFKDSCGIDAVCVTSLEAHPVQPGSEPIVYEIMEPHGPQEKDPSDREWVTVSSLVENGFRYPLDFHAVRQAVAQSIKSAEESSHRPFTHLGWFHQIEQWVRAELRPHGLHLNGRFRQLNAHPTFSLIRFETDGRAVWFKAVGTPNERECTLTLALAHSFSRFLPRVIAMRPECNGWLALEAEGPLLQECSEIASWETAARDLAQLQILSLDKCTHLLERGARDLRTSALAELAEPYMQTMGEVMERQAKPSPSPLSRNELRGLATRVLDALALLDRASISTTLGHLDLNPENIVCSPASCVFLDWAEGFVGHPFLTFEYLREHFRRTFGQQSPQEAQLLTGYVSPWRALVDERDTRCALNVTPLVAAFACGVGNDVWTNPRRLEEPRTAGYLRSLTRRMMREANAVAERSEICPN